MRRPQLRRRRSRLDPRETSSCGQANRPASPRPTETAERQAVRRDHPLPIRGREVQRTLRGRQRDVHHRQVKHDHELRDADHSEGEPRRRPVDMALTAPGIALISYLCYEVVGSSRHGRADMTSAKTHRRDRRHRRRRESAASVPWDRSWPREYTIESRKSLVRGSSVRRFDEAERPRSGGNGRPSAEHSCDPGLRVVDAASKPNDLRT